MKIPFLNRKELDKSVNFFDLSSRDKKKIVKKAVEESTKKQVKLLKENGYLFNTR